MTPATLTPDELRHLRAGHVALWTWLAETGNSAKSLWPGWMHNGGSWDDARFGNFCLACEAMEGNGCHDGEGCPINWGTASNGCLGEGSIYDRWGNALGLETRKELATIIATMWPEVQG